MYPLSSFRLALGSPTLANSGPAPAGSLKDDSGMRGHLAAEILTQRLPLSARGALGDALGYLRDAPNGADHRKAIRHFNRKILPKKIHCLRTNQASNPSLARWQQNEDVSQ